MTFFIFENDSVAVCHVDGVNAVDAVFHLNAVCSYVLHRRSAHTAWNVNEIL